MGISQRGADSTGVSLSQAVVEAIAKREGIDATELEPPEYEPLYAVVDPEALDALFSPTVDGRDRAPGSIGFEYGGYDVTVHSVGQVELSR